jgi:hypothetical protein
MCQNESCFVSLTREKKTSPIVGKCDASAARFAYILAKIAISCGNDITPYRALNKKTAKSRRHDENPLSSAPTRQTEFDL